MNILAYQKWLLKLVEVHKEYRKKFSYSNGANNWLVYRNKLRNIPVLINYRDYYNPMQRIRNFVHGCYVRYLPENYWHLTI